MGQVKKNPGYNRSDNGSDFTAKILKEWLESVKGSTVYIEPGSPWENGYCESFNGKKRDGFLNHEIFDRMFEVEVLTKKRGQHKVTMKNLAKLLFLTLNALILSIATGLFVILYISQALAYVLIICAGLWFMIYLMVKFHWAYVMTAIFVIAAGAFIATFVYNVVFWIEGDTVKDVTLPEAVQNKNATVFYFNEGMPESNIWGMFMVTGAGGQSSAPSHDYYYVVPVVNEKWTIDQSVYVWAACFVPDEQLSYGLEECMNDWNQPYRAGLREPYSANFYEAVKNAEEEFGVQSAENAVVIQWIDDPQAEIKNNLDQSIKAPLWVFSLALFYTIVVFFIITFFGK